MRLVLVLLPFLLACGTKSTMSLSSDGGGTTMTILDAAMPAGPMVPHEQLALAPDSTIRFMATTLYADRFPSTCGIKPPFKDDDLFSLRAIGKCPRRMRRCASTSSRRPGWR